MERVEPQGFGVFCPGFRNELVGVRPSRVFRRAAKLFFDHHRADAPIRAAQRADELLAAGDIEGRAVWLLMPEAVKELIATKLPGPLH